MTTHINIDTLSGINHKVRISVRFLNNRTAMELVDMYKLRSDRGSEHEIVSGYIRRSSKNQSGKRTAHVAAKQFTVGREASGRNHYPVLAKIVRFVKVALNPNADHTTCIVR